MKKITLLFIFISALILPGKAQVNCSNICVLGINNIDTAGSNFVDVIFSNADTNAVNYPTVVVTNSIGDTVCNKTDYFNLFMMSGHGDSTTVTIPTSWDSIPFGFTGTVYLMDRIDSSICSFAYPMSCTVGIHEVSANNNLMIYPNPATTTINISLNYLKNEEAYYTIYDCTGKQVRHFSSSSRENTLDRGDLPNGIYFVNVLVGNKLLTKKIILE